MAPDRTPGKAIAESMAENSRGYRRWMMWLFYATFFSIGRIPDRLADTLMQWFYAYVRYPTVARVVITWVCSGAGKSREWSEELRIAVPS